MCKNGQADGEMIVSSFLFATPKFIDGVASVIDLFGVYTAYNDAPTGEEADRRAITADMQAMREDMMIAFHNVIENV